MTAPANLTLLCPTHHRALHHGQFSVYGNAENGTLRFHDPWGAPIEPPGLDPPEPDPPGGPPDAGGDPPPYTPPLGERLTADTFAWN